LFFENINKIDEPLVNLTKTKRERLKLLKLKTNNRLSQQTTMPSKGSLENISKTYSKKF
jgi:hypothetical protein